MSSESRVLVVQIADVSRHPEADRLDLIRIRFDRELPPADYLLVSQTGTWKVGDYAAYVPVDMDVPTGRPNDADPASPGPFSFLAERARADGFHRVKAMRLRGVFSMGLLVPVPFSHPILGGKPASYTIGNDVTEALGVRKWEPAPDNSVLHGDAESPPSHFTLPVYDIEPWRKYRLALAKPLDAAVMRVADAVGAGNGDTLPAAMAHVARFLQDTDKLETVVAREKIHGACASFVHDGERLWVRSRTTYKKLDSPCVWNDIAKRYNFAGSLADYPKIAIYGEVYGQVQDLKYGVPPGESRFVLFDAYDLEAARWLDDEQLTTLAEALALDLAPELYRGPWSMLPPGVENGLSVLCAQNLGIDLTISTKRDHEVHMREGVVIRPVVERVQPNPTLPSRVILKLVGQDYLLRKGG
jgi:hypothetical protein